LDATVNKLVREMAQLANRQHGEFLAHASADITAEQWLATLATMGLRQVAERRLGSRIARRVGLPGDAKGRILAYMKLNVGQVLDKDELSGVSGIYEWARRVRELRIEEGWPISSDQTRDDLKPGQYVLEDAEPDLQLRTRWQTANQIRRTKGSAASRILLYFRENVGKTVSKDELRYVSRIQEHPRRVRELAEAGWQIDSNLDRAELRSGEYVLKSLEQLPAHAREHIKLRFRILERDGFRCRSCGAQAGSGRLLQVHHIQTVKQKGTNDAANLETLCDACHAGKHAIAPSDVVDEILHPELERDLGP
jgi:hypothetical protein